ncbi:hypothetical protein ACFZAV_45175 [Streptomyces sp. NPDC008343]|uniref:hypothetical protein n=1 Tax=Streptomyces sp. NPDC008343 TaxID=3364828 RepID=UPI0036E3C457
MPFFVGPAYLGGWLLREPDWDWTTLTHKGFERLFDRSVAEFGALDTDTPDLPHVRDAAARVLLFHGSRCRAR